MSGARASEIVLRMSVCADFGTVHRCRKAGNAGRVNVMRNGNEFRGYCTCHRNCEVKLLVMPLNRTTRAFSLCAPVMLMLALSACEPSYSLAWAKDFDKPIEISCIRDALKSGSVDITQGTYVSDGARGFPRGANVTQFGYADPSGNGHFDVDIAKLNPSRTRFYHSFEKLGNRPSADDVQRSAALLNANNGRIASKCGLKFSKKDLQES